MTGSSNPPHLNFPTFRPKSKTKGISNLDHVQSIPIPPTPSFGLFMPTPIPASSNLASPYLTYSPIVHPASAQPAPQFSKATLSTAARTVALNPAPTAIIQQPRYQLYEPLQAHEGAFAEAGWMSPLPPTPIPQIRPLPIHPNPFDAPPRTPPRFLPAPPREVRSQPAPHRHIQHKPQTDIQLQPGQVLPTSSTEYCRQIKDIAITPTRQLNRPSGPRQSTNSLLTHPMHRGSSSNRTSYSSSSTNATDLRRRSALKSLPPTRDYSSSSNKSHRASLLATVNHTDYATQDFIDHSTHVLPTTQQFVESPPQAEFIPDISDSSLSWQPEMEEEDEARAVWRKLEMKMGRRMHSGLDQQRGRWIVTPLATPLPTYGAEMSPGQFSVSDYMTFGDGEEDEGVNESEVYALNIHQPTVRGTPYPHPESDIRRSRRTKSRRLSTTTSSARSNSSSRTTTRLPPSALDTLDSNLFPIFPSNTPKAAQRKIPKPQPEPRRSPLCRLDTQVVSALEALQNDWASPDLDLALLGNQPSPTTPKILNPPPISRPLPLPSLTRRSASPANPVISTPPPIPRSIPPPSPLERGLGLGLSMALGTTYNLPSKPTPIIPSRPAPSRKNTRPLPTPVQSAERGKSIKSTILTLSRRSTMRVDRAKKEGMFVIRDLDTGEACEVGMEGLEAALSEMASRA